MLNGVAPILIFQFKKLLPDILGIATEAQKQIPIASETKSTFPLPLIPLYLDERLTGLYIDTESKNVDIETQTDSLSSGDSENINQRAISNIVKIEMIANRDSIGISLLSAMSDLIFPKVTSKEYSLTYLHGAITVFDGLLHSFSINQNSNNELYQISMEIVKPSALKIPVPIVGRVAGAARP